MRKGAERSNASAPFLFMVMSTPSGSEACAVCSLARRSTQFNSTTNGKYPLPSNLCKTRGRSFGESHNAAEHEFSQRSALVYLLQESGSKGVGDFEHGAKHGVAQNNSALCYLNKNHFVDEHLS